ncbi:RNA-binding S4 domain-containing protein, partial [Kibdelosporangium lantanae]
MRDRLDTTAELIAVAIPKPRTHIGMTVRTSDARPAADRTFDIRQIAPGDVTISGEVIRLGQFLGLAGLAVGALDAKVMIEEGWVTVNGRVETQPGRQLRPGDPG